MGDLKLRRTFDFYEFCCNFCQWINSSRQKNPQYFPFYKFEMLLLIDNFSVVEKERNEAFYEIVDDLCDVQFACVCVKLHACWVCCTNRELGKEKKDGVNSSMNSKTTNDSALETVSYAINLSKLWKRFLFAFHFRRVFPSISTAIHAYARAEYSQYTQVIKITLGTFFATGFVFFCCCFFRYWAHLSCTFHQAMNWSTCTLSRCLTLRLMMRIYFIFLCCLPVSSSCVRFLSFSAHETIRWV